MVHFTTLLRIFKEKPRTMQFFRMSYVAYTTIIIFVSGFVISSLQKAIEDETCDEWSALPSDWMTSDNSTTYHACTNLISGSKEVTDVNGAAAFLALILFLIYFYFQVTSLQLLQQVIPVLFVDDMLEPNESDATSAALMKGQKSSSDFSAPVPTSTSPPAPTLNHQIATTMGTYRVCKFVILVCVEIVGLWMIFNSTSNHEVIINSTAAFFLCELDAYVLNCIVQHYLLVEPVTGEFDTELVNIEFSTNDLGEYFKKLEQDRLEKEKKANAINPVN